MLNMWNFINLSLVTGFVILTLHKCSEQAEAKKAEEEQRRKKAKAKEEEDRINNLMSFKGHRNRVQTVHFSSDGQMILTASHDGTARVWDVATGKCEQIFGTGEEHRCGVESARWSSKNNQVITVDGTETIRVWDVATGKCIHTLNYDKTVYRGIRPINKLADAKLSWDDKSIVSVGREMVGVWSAEKGHLRYFTDLPKVISAQLSPDGRSILGVNENMTFCKWFAPSGNEIVQAIENREEIMFQKWKGNKNNKDNFTVSSVHFVSTWGVRAVSAVNFSNVVCVSDIATGVRLLELKGHSDWVRSAHFSLNGRSIVSAGSDRTVRVWNEVTGKCVHVLEGHSDVVNFVQFSPDGKSIASASRDNTVRVWNAVTGKMRTDIGGRRRCEFLEFI